MKLVTTRLETRSDMLSARRFNDSKIQSPSWQHAYEKSSRPKPKSRQKRRQQQQHRARPKRAPTSLSVGQLWSLARDLTSQKAFSSIEYGACGVFRVAPCFGLASFALISPDNRCFVRLVSSSFGILVPIVDQVAPLECSIQVSLLASTLPFLTTYELVVVLTLTVGYNYKFRFQERK